MKTEAEVETEVSDDEEEENLCADEFEDFTCG
jgi:hypothetical protein